MPRSLLHRTTLLSLPALLTIAACGSGDDSASSADGPIELFQIAPIESQVASLPFAESSAHAAVEAINADGGINGRKLKLTTCNDKFDPNEAGRCAKKATTSDAVALVGSVLAVGDLVWPSLAAAKLPSIGNYPRQPRRATSR